MDPLSLAILFTFIFASILLIVTGSWNNFIFKLLRNSKIFKNELVGDFVYAVIVTLFGLIVLYLLIKFLNKRKDVKKAGKDIVQKNVLVKILS